MRVKSSIAASREVGFPRSERSVEHAYRFDVKPVNRLQLLDIHPRRQITASYCGPTSLKMVLEKYRICKTERQLAVFSHTKNNQGCEERDLVRAAAKLGIKAFTKNNSSLKEIARYLANDVPVIVTWWKILDSRNAIAW